MLIKAAIAALFLFPLFEAVGVPSALQSDVRLIQLVPPESQIVSGISLGSFTPRKLPTLLVLTRDNKIDFQDLFAVIGTDASRILRQLIFVAAAGQNGFMSEHTLLVSGQFNPNAIIRFVGRVKGRMERYRNLPVQVVPPLRARPARSMKSVGWSCSTLRS